MARVESPVWYSLARIDYVFYIQIINLGLRLIVIMVYYHHLLTFIIKIYNRKLLIMCYCKS